MINVTPYKKMLSLYVDSDDRILSEKNKQVAEGFINIISEHGSQVSELYTAMVDLKTEYIAIYDSADQRELDIIQSLICGFAAAILREKHLMAPVWAVLLTIPLSDIFPMYEPCSDLTRFAMDNQVGKGQFSEREKDCIMQGEDTYPFSDRISPEVVAYGQRLLAYWKDQPSVLDMVKNMKKQDKK